MTQKNLETTSPLAQPINLNNNGEGGMVFHIGAIPKSFADAVRGFKAADDEFIAAHAHCVNSIGTRFMKKIRDAYLDAIIEQSGRV